MDAFAITQILSPATMVFAAVIIILGCIIQSGLGMGFGLMVAPLMALIDQQLVPAPTLFLGLFTALWGAWLDRSHIRWNEVWLAGAGRTAGVLVGLLLIFWLSGAGGFSLLFGIMVLSAVVLSVTGHALPFNWLSLSAMGLVSGTMGTITSVGAPPLALVYQGREPQASRATLAAFFALGCAVSLAGLFVSGFAGVRDVYLALAMVPPMVFGMWFAQRFKTGFVRWYRPWLLCVAGAAGLLLMAKGVL